MRIGPSLILATRQTLAMTPQLQQAIKLLQFSHLELAAYIQQELEKNPLLSEGSSDEGPIGEPDPTPVEAPVDTAEALAAAAPALAVDAVREGIDHHVAAVEAEPGQEALEPPARRPDEDPPDHGLVLGGVLAHDQDAGRLVQAPAVEDRSPLQAEVVDLQD